MTPVTWLTGFPGPQNSAAPTRRLPPRSEQDYPLPQKHSNFSIAIMGINPAAFCSCSCTVVDVEYQMNRVVSASCQIQLSRVTVTGNRINRRRRLAVAGAATVKGRETVCGADTRC